MSLLSWVFRLCCWGSAVALWLMAILVTVDVFSRFTFNKPFAGVFEASEVGFMMVVFFTLAWTHHQNRAMTVTFVSDRIKGRASYVLKLLSDLVCLAFFGLLMWYAQLDFVRSWRTGDVRQGLVQIPWTVPAAAVTVGTLFMCLILLITAGRNLRSIIVPPPPEAAPLAPAAPKEGLGI